MTSAERREKRYWRRREKRIAKKQKTTVWRDEFKWVFTYHHLRKSYQKCCKGVRWKPSVQRYISKAPLFLCRSLDALHSGRYRAMHFWKFWIMERGKLRHIQSLHFRDRVIQRCLCDYVLVPVLQRRFVSDNCACLKGKGQHYALSRVTEFLRRHYRKYGTNGYVLQFDFSKFFENIDHLRVKKLVFQYIHDAKIRSLVCQLIDDFEGHRGLGLGSQISQILALTYADGLDHLLKEKLRIRGYVRYNDDGFILSHDKNFLKKVMAQIQSYCQTHGLILNTKKTQIVKLSHGFTFLKARFYLTSTGKIIKKLPKKNASRMRKKLRKLTTLILNGNRPLSVLQDCITSWFGFAKHFHSWRTRENMCRLYQVLINCVRQREGGAVHAVLQQHL